MTSVYFDNKGEFMCDVVVKRLWQMKDDIRAIMPAVSLHVRRDNNFHLAPLSSAYYSPARGPILLPVQPSFCCIDDGDHVRRQQSTSSRAHVSRELLPPQPQRQNDVRPHQTITMSCRIRSIRCRTLTWRHAQRAWLPQADHPVRQWIQLKFPDNAPFPFRAICVILSHYCLTQV